MTEASTSEATSPDDDSSWRAALRRYFLNGVVWTVLAVPVVFGLAVMGVPLWSWVIGNDWKNEQKIEATTVGMGTAITLSLMLLLFCCGFVPGWRIMQRSGKGIGMALMAGAAGLVVYSVMSVIYLAAALGLTWFLLYKM